MLQELHNSNINTDYNGKARIVFPTSAYRRGAAFEYLILSYYNTFSAVRVEEWSSCIYGKSGTLYQCDGILHDGRKRYLFEAKFFYNKKASIRDMHPERREAAAIDLDCDGILCVSLNGFDESVRTWQRNGLLEIILFGWEDLRVHILSRISDFATVLLDNLRIFDRMAINDSGNTLHFIESPSYKLLPQFPEFVSFPDSLELWLRRLPKFDDYQQQLSSGRFVYNNADETVKFTVGRNSELSLADAWQIEDSALGFSARTYNAMKATMQALYNSLCSLTTAFYDSDVNITVVQDALRQLGWKTGMKGVRKALDDLIILGFVSKRSVGVKTHYALTPLGYTFVVVEQHADDLFIHQLRQWPPYRFMRDAILSNTVTPDRNTLLEYFKAQYRPYEPYARCPFNQNTTDGVLALFKKFG